MCSAGRGGSGGSLSPLDQGASRVWSTRGTLITNWMDRVARLRDQLGAKTTININTMPIEGDGRRTLPFSRAVNCAVRGVQAVHARGGVRRLVNVRGGLVVVWACGRVALSIYVTKCASYGPRTRFSSGHGYPGDRGLGHRLSNIENCIGVIRIK